MLLLGLLLMVLSSCSMEERSAIRASKSTFSPWFNASANAKKLEHEEKKSAVKEITGSRT